MNTSTLLASKGIMKRTTAHLWEGDGFNQEEADVLRLLP